MLPGQLFAVAEGLSGGFWATKSRNIVRIVACLVRVQVHVSWIESGTAVFSFRGTESTQDGLQDIKMLRRNIDYLQRGYPGAKAHTGALHVNAFAGASGGPSYKG